MMQLLHGSGKKSNSHNITNVAMAGQLKAALRRYVALPVSVVGGRHFDFKRYNTKKRDEAVEGSALVAQKAYLCKLLKIGMSIWPFLQLFRSLHR